MIEIFGLDYAAGIREILPISIPNEATVFKVMKCFLKKLKVHKILDRNNAFIVKKKSQR